MGFACMKKVCMDQILIIKMTYETYWISIYLLRVSTHLRKCDDRYGMQGAFHLKHTNKIWHLNTKSECNELVTKKVKFRINFYTT